MREISKRERRARRRDERRTAHEATHVDGALVQRHCHGDYGQGAVHEAGATEAGDGAADDEHLGRVGDAAEQRANLKYGEEGEKGGLGVEVSVDFAGEGLQRAVGEEVRAAVPADVLEGVEVARDSGDSLWRSAVSSQARGGI